MPEEAHLKVSHIIQGAAESAVGGSGGETGKKSGIEEGTEKPEEKKKKKSMFGQISGIFTSVLGMQVTFAAMLRQSQIATGWLGAVFQVAGAILDSFLLAFAPALFRIIEVMTTFIPVARAMGEAIASQIGDVWEWFKGWGTTVVTKLTTLWNIIAKIGEIFSNHPILWKILAALYFLPKLLNFFQVPFLMKLMGGIKRELTYHRIKSARASRGGKGRGMGMMGMMMPQAQLLGLVMMAVPIISAIMGKGKGGEDTASAVDVTGQLGKRYLPSQASQMGGTLNEAYSAMVQPFTDVVKPEMETFGTAVAAVGAALDASRDATSISQEEAQAAIVAATDNWVTDLSKNTKIQENDYALMHIGQDATIAALERQKKAIDEGNTNWKVGSEQSKNQWHSTASYAHDTVVEASDKVVNILAKGDMERAMGNMVGAFDGTSDAFMMMYNQDAKALKEAAVKQKEATIAFEVMTQTVMNGYTEDRADAKRQREEIGTALLGADNPMLAYLSSEY